LTGHSDVNIVCHQPVCHYVAPLLGGIKSKQTSLPGKHGIITETDDPAARFGTLRNNYTSSGEMYVTRW